MKSYIGKYEKKKKVIIMIKFFQTRMGRKFYESDVPRIAMALENIANELKRQNDLQEGK